MLRLFSSIRQQLLAENKTVTYLKYAVGEVLLVMIGILLALQVNNWNEGRKDRIEEVEVLLRIQEELETHVTLLNRYQETPLRRKERLSQIESAFAGEPIQDPLVFLDNVASAKNFGWTVPQQRRITFDELADSNKIGLIRNTKLREAITAYYHGVETSQGMLSFRKSNFSDLVFELLPMPNRNDVEKGLSDETYARLVESILESDLHKYITSEKNRSDFIHYFWTNYTARAEQLIQDIQAQLKK